MNEFDFIQWSIDNGFGKVEFNAQQMNMIAHFQSYVNQVHKGNVTINKDFKIIDNGDGTITVSNLWGK